MQQPSHGTYRLGAVVYHPKVEQIWSAFGEWFAEAGFGLAVTYFDSYEDQLDALTGVRLDAAWNTNLAYAQTQLRTGGRARAIAMRDSDSDWRSRLVVRGDSDFASLEDLVGCRVGFGDADSPQAHILPVQALIGQGVHSQERFVASRLDRDVGKHGDTAGAELAQLARVRSGRLDACVVSSVTFDALGRVGDASGLRVIWTSPPFHHCNFTVLEDSRADHERFKELLLSMDAADPKLCEPMELEYVNQWVDFDARGYEALIEIVRRGAVIVG